MQPLKIVLASESQFRRRAMDMVGVPYETRPASIDEKAIRHDDAAELTRQLASQFHRIVVTNGFLVNFGWSRLIGQAHHVHGAAAELRFRC